MLILLVLITPLLVWSAWQWGQRDAKPISDVMPISDLHSFQVTGNSMAPTLLGACKIAECELCQLYWYVDVTSTRRKSSRVLCSHCGEQMKFVDRAQIPQVNEIAADVVEIRPLSMQTLSADATDLKRGDLVAIEWDGQLHVKRIAALPGDVVKLDGPRLKIDDKRFEDLLVESKSPVDLPQFLVDDDSRREVSRWSSEATDSPWQRTDSRRWRWTGPSMSPWLIYNHKSVYDHDRPSRVWDDYQINVGLDRKLYGVDRLQLDGTVHCQSPTAVLIAFWSGAGNVLGTISVSKDQTLAVSYHDGALADDLPVTAEHPIAIRVAAGPFTFESLKIQRLIEYRLRPGDDRDRYPLPVGPGQCFVLGDNVPVSVDSRDMGLVPISSIVGLVTKRQQKAKAPEIR
jgi:type IV secretory pathway protease TraF